MGSQYLTTALDFDTRKKVIRKAMKFLKTHKDSFDVIAVTGSSGLLVGPVLADKLGKELILVRKPTENSHSSAQIEFTNKLYDTHKDKKIRYFIIDDLVASGETVMNIVDAMDKSGAFELTGLYCYNQPLKSDRFLRPGLLNNIRDGAAYEVLRGKIIGGDRSGND